MKQLVVKKGKVLPVEVPEPVGAPRCVLVETRCSCVSPGTEMAGVKGSSRSLLQRVIAQPDKAKLALKRMRAEGVAAVWSKAKQAIEQEGLCGYSAAGVVIDVGEGATGFRRGMRVAIAGAGHANHAEIALVPMNLAVPLPDDLDFAAGSTVALGAIALQGIRRAGVALGDQVAVIGCGALGILAVQMLRASGCRVFAADLDARRLEMALALGADACGNPGIEDVVSKATRWSGGHGVDAVLVMAATSSGEPVSQAFRMSRVKGRVVLVGVAGGEYRRDEMYRKELDFVISTSYGPGRYDDGYELDGRDYPYGYVRWTENRNMAAYLEMVARGAVHLEPLIEIRRPLAEAELAYSELQGPERPLLAVLDYETGEAAREEAARPPAAGTWQTPTAGQALRLGLIGAGSFVRGMHVPILASMPERFSISWCCSKTGASARGTSLSIPGSRATTDFDEVLADPGTHAVLIGTRHDTHADLAIRALKAGKGVILEKPMCLTPAEFSALTAAVEESAAPFFVGYNRRFSPFARIIREAAVSRVEPMMIQYTMNAGHVPVTHWTQGKEGGGRLMGEACHIIDLFRSLTGSPVGSVSCEPLRSTKGTLPTDNFVLTLGYEDGSVATLLYTSLGHPGLPKEQFKVFFDGKAFLVEDYLKLECHGHRGANLETRIQDKGHRTEIEEFHATVSRGERFPIPWLELSETWRVSHEADRLCREGPSE
jgi:predicted dehydrogenase/threonine dehydrogenase-like Zn-dependent dehydrogenase